MAIVAISKWFQGNIEVSQEHYCLFGNISKSRGFGIRHHRITRLRHGRNGYGELVLLRRVDEHFLPVVRSRRPSARETASCSLLSNRSFTEGALVVVKHDGLGKGKALMVAAVSVAARRKYAVLQPSRSCI